MGGRQAVRGRGGDRPALAGRMCPGSPVQGRKSARRAVPIPAASGIPGQDRVGELGCGFRGCGGAQVQPAGCRAGVRGGGTGAGLAKAKGRVGAGLGAPGAAQQLFLDLTRTGERSLRDGFRRVSRCKGPCAIPERLQSPGQAQDAARTERGRAAAADVSAQSR